MRSRRTVHTNKVFRLPGGTEDNDLWTYEINEADEPAPIQCSIWVPTPEELEALNNGAQIRLNIWGSGHPPVMLDVVNEELKGVERAS